MLHLVACCMERLTHKLGLDLWKTWNLFYNVHLTRLLEFLFITKKAKYLAY